MTARHDAPAGHRNSCIQGTCQGRHHKSQCKSVELAVMFSGTIPLVHYNPQPRKANMLYLGSLITFHVMMVGSSAYAMPENVLILLTTADA
eukprot:365306-Chlamydomonas_euryale.AAC.9